MSIVTNKLTDFNDLANTQGKKEVARQIMQVIANPPSAESETNEPDLPPTKESDYQKKLTELLDEYKLIIDDVNGRVTNKFYHKKTDLEMTKKQFTDRHNQCDNKLKAEFLAKVGTINRTEITAIRKAKAEENKTEPMSMWDRYVLIYGTKEIWDNLKKERYPIDAIKLANPSLYDVWLKSDGRKMVEKENLVFDPSEKTDTKDENTIRINTFGGLPVKNKELKVDLETAIEIADPILKLLIHLCENNKKLAKWVLNWLAIPIQNLGTKMDTALIFHGEVQGAGKSLFFDRIMSRIYGDYSVTLGQGQLESQYNGWVENRLFAVFEEIFAGSDRYSHSGLLKQIITGDEIYINEKFQVGRKQKNHVNCVFLSNEMIPIFLEQNDRRYVVCQPKRKIPQPLLEEISQALKDPEQKVIRAFYTVLLKTDTTGQTKHSIAMKSTAKKKIIEMSQPNWQTFLQQWENEEFGVIYSTCTSDDLYKLYVTWCKRGNERTLQKSKFQTFIGTRYCRKRLRFTEEGKKTDSFQQVICVNMPSSFPHDEQIIRTDPKYHATTEKKRFNTQKEWTSYQVWRFRQSMKKLYNQQPSK